jgi:hypothetical protein
MAALHLKLRRLGLVADQQIHATSDIETQPLDRPQHNRLRCQAELKGYRLMRN